jgi:hypothetical protein
VLGRWSIQHLQQAETMNSRLITCFGCVACSLRCPAHWCSVSIVHGLHDTIDAKTICVPFVRPKFVAKSCVHVHSMEENMSVCAANQAGRCWHGGCNCSRNQLGDCRGVDTNCGVCAANPKKNLPLLLHALRMHFKINKLDRYTTKCMPHTAHNT